MSKNKDTGLKDDYGNTIKDGDSIEWTYDVHGVMIKDENGVERFLGCVTSGDMIQKTVKEKKTITYQVRGDVAGYFLDRPCGMSTTFIKEKPKCKLIK